MNILRLYWKTPTFVWIINLTFLLVDFYTFWTNENRNEYFTKNQQNLQHHPNCVSTLPNVKTSHFETTVADRFLVCVRSNPLFATFEESHLMFVFFIFLCTEFLSVFWQNFFLNFHRFLIKILSSTSIQNSIYLMLRSNSMK